MTVTALIYASHCRPDIRPPAKPQIATNGIHHGHHADCHLQHLSTQAPGNGTNFNLTSTTVYPAFVTTNGVEDTAMTTGVNHKQNTRSTSSENNYSLTKSDFMTKIQKSVTSSTIEHPNSGVTLDFRREWEKRRCAFRSPSVL